MSLHLTAQDLARLGAATEALLAPAPDGDPWAWWRGAEARLRELFPGSNVMLSMPEGERLRNDSDSIESQARERITQLTTIDRAGHFLIRDPAIEAWVAYRRTHRMEVWSTRENLRIIEAMGFDGRRSVFGCTRRRCSTSAGCRTSRRWGRRSCRSATRAAARRASAATTCRC